MCLLRGKSTPAKRAKVSLHYLIKFAAKKILSLALLMLLVDAVHHDNAFSLKDPAFTANFFYGRPYFHYYSPVKNYLLPLPDLLRKVTLPLVKS